MTHLYIATNVVIFFCSDWGHIPGRATGTHKGPWRSALKGGGDEDDENVDAEAT